LTQLGPRQFNFTAMHSSARELFYGWIRPEATAFARAE
jgi:hypothetical protein